MSNILNLRKAFEKRNNGEVNNIMNKIGNNWIYLIAAPNLRNGIPDNLSTVFLTYAKQISKYITAFYLNESFEFSDKIFSCSVVDEQKKVLSIKISTGSYYELLLFR